MPVPIDPLLHSPPVEEETPALPETTQQDILNCALPSWLNQFRSATFRTKVLPLPAAFIEYLNEDGIYLPEDGYVKFGMQTDMVLSNQSQPRAATIEELDDGDDDEEEEDKNTRPNFPDIEEFIRASIRDLGGSVFPKLTWSSPRDAAWIASTQSLKCTSPFDVFLLLKSSDFVNHDLNHAFEHCGHHEESSVDHYLVLRKWQDLQPSMEFRVFVKNKEIIGISQRDLTFYKFMEEMKDEIEDMIYDFFEDHVQQVFLNNNYVMDVYVEKERRKVWIVDFNPLTPATDGLLYEWSELAQLNPPQDEPEFRTVGSEAEANAHACRGPRFATNMVPRDMIDLSGGRTVAEFAEEFQRAMMLADTQDSSSEDEDEQRGIV